MTVWAVPEQIRHVCELLRNAGGKAYVVGGACRDMALGREPKDYDVVTDLTPDQIDIALGGCKVVGRAFLVTLIQVDGMDIEVATFRKEGGYEDGRRPDEVEIGTMLDDASRRDFTCNSIYYDPIVGELVDPNGGMTDIAKKTLVAVGSAMDRLNEDWLRILRAVRFCLRCGFSMDRELTDACVALAPKLASVASERVRDEITCCLQSGGNGMRMLRDVGILEAVLPEVHALYYCAQDPEWHPEGDVGIHTEQVLEYLPNRGMIACWAALLHDVGKPATFQVVNGRITAHGHAKEGADIATAICERLRFPNAAKDAVAWLVHKHMDPMQARDMRKSTLRRLAGHPLFPRLMDLHYADCLGSTIDPEKAVLDNFHFLQAFKDRMAQEPMLPVRMLRGQDVLELGVVPGPLVGKILEAAYVDQLEGKYKTRRDALLALPEIVAAMKEEA